MLGTTTWSNMEVLWNGSNAAIKLGCTWRWLVISRHRNLGCKGENSVCPCPVSNYNSSIIIPSNSNYSHWTVAVSVNGAHCPCVHASSGFHTASFPEGILNNFSAEYSSQRVKWTTRLHIRHRFRRGGVSNYTPHVFIKLCLSMCVCTQFFPEFT